ncbi:hypothetical protein [Spirosoma agri]|jgi:hypothetical protein|uniref:Uncharacterized protein n=1 Tax=Spirosoma agri TaxID=1987381 RepID=A0A6M0IRS8_9BACT|nr:hypothetical protein [Spirosoma agri]NEU70970.1 hypothetical protein [Spirosoma agri]
MLDIPAQYTRRIRTIGFYQIIGGGVGLLMMGWALSTNEASKGILIFTASGCLLLGFSIVCGWGLLNGDKRALPLSIINQSLQIIMIGIGGFLFKYCAGLYVMLGIKFIDELKMTADIGLSTFELNINSGEQGAVSFNLIAILLFISLLRLQEQIKQYYLLKKGIG